LALTKTPDIYSELVSVRRVEEGKDEYEVLDPNGKSLGVGNTQWAIEMLSMEVSKAFG